MCNMHFSSVLGDAGAEKIVLEFPLATQKSMATAVEINEERKVLIDSMVTDDWRENG